MPGGEGDGDRDGEGTGELGSEPTAGLYFVLVFTNLGPMMRVSMYVSACESIADALVEGFV